MERAAGETMAEGTMIPTSASSGGGGDGGGGGGDGSLPFDAVVEILARLRVKSLARFRCVCKPWCSLTFDPYFIKKHHRIASSSFILFSYLGPLALYDIGSREITKYTSPPRTKDLLWQHMLSNSVDGLVCGFVANSIFLSNLSTGKAARLPPPPNSGVATVGLGFDASTGAYKLLRIFPSPRSPRGCACEALTLCADQEWRYLGPSPPISPLRQLFYFNGFIHWIHRRENKFTGTSVVVVAFDCKYETFSTIPAPKSACSGQAEVVSFEGHLCFADAHNYCLKILMLEDYARPVWTTVLVINCTALDVKLTRLRITGIENGKVLLQDSWRLDKKFTIYSYDLRSKVWSQMTCRQESLGLRLYTESLISPRRLLNVHGEREFG